MVTIEAQVTISCDFSFQVISHFRRTACHFGNGAGPLVIKGNLFPVINE